VPVGKVKWYDSEKGFGFLSKEEGGDVYVRSDALPAGVTNLKPGQKVEFGVVEGRRGEQALQVRLIDPPQLVIEDLIKLLDNLGEGYRRGRHPDAKAARQVATVLRGVADKLDI
jgi:CspA family cold shock protein